MKNVNERNYPNIKEAVAFTIAFAPMVYSYGNVGWDEIEEVVCSRCGKTRQYFDFLAPSSNCVKFDGAILDSYHFGISINVKNELINRFDISEEDFRPVRNKVGKIVFYQITPRHIMRPISDVNNFRILKPCPKCGSIQYREKEPVNDFGNSYGFISKEALEDLHDLNESCEHFEMHLPKWIVRRR